MSTVPSDQLKTLINPSIEEFIEGSKTFSEPVVIVGGAHDWPASQKWNPKYLLSKVGSLPVLALANSTGFFDGDEEKGYSKIEVRMPFRNFWAIISATQQPTKYYLAQNSIDMGAFSVIADDITNPRYIPAGSKITRNIWLGPGNTISPLHFDMQNNFFAQISGSKRFLLFSPKQSEYLYPYSKHSKIPHMSRVNVDKPDFAKFPEFKKAECLDVMLAPGDLLFIPMYWWHQVYSLSMSISLNFWWK